MANWYVTSDAAGGGTGAIGSPYTIAEAAAKSYSAGDYVWIKSGTYDLSASLTWVGTQMSIRGYNNTIGDLDSVWGETNKPIMRGVTNSFGQIWNHTGNSIVTYNTVFFGNGKSDRGPQGSNSLAINNCVLHGFSAKASYATFQSVVNCIWYSNGAGITGKVFYGCLAYLNSSSAYSAFSATNCISYNNTGTGFDVNLEECCFINCLAANNTSYGFSLGYGVSAINCIAANNGNYGYYGGGGWGLVGSTINCNAYGNTNGATSGTYNISLDTTNPALTNVAGLDFTVGTNMRGKGAYQANLIAPTGLDLGAMQIYTAAATAPTFAGIVQLESTGSGTLRATWSAATGTCTGYNIYVRQGASPAFGATYLKCKVDSATTEFIFRMDSDNTTFIDGTQAVYVGVRAENSGTEDANSVELNIIPTGTGTYMKPYTEAFVV
jgi:hypothetical protein